MDIEHRIEGTTATVVLHGQFVYSTHTAIRPLVYPMLEQTDLTEIHLDLGDVSYLDSSALGLLLVIKEKAEANGKTVCLMHPSTQAMAILKVVKFEQVFRIIS